MKVWEMAHGLGDPVHQVWVLPRGLGGPGHKVCVLPHGLRGPKAPTLGDMPGCVCKEKESTLTGRENVAVVGGAMLGCPMWGYLGSMLTHLGSCGFVLGPSEAMLGCRKAILEHAWLYRGHVVTVCGAS
jgi:hypothetical protein